MNKTLVFEPCLTGHHLEYLHYYYLGALKNKDQDYVFLVSRNFTEVKHNYEWPASNNISIEYIEEKYDKKLSAINIYKLAWNTSCVLRHYVKKYRPNKILLTMLMQYIPFILFLLPNTVRVRGIMYKIYLYEQKRMSFARLMLEKIRFWLASFSPILETVFVLNDSDSSEKLNKIYHTDKFKYLPDPIPEVNMNELTNLRTELGISQEDVVFLHFGGLDKRKGTIDILRAIIDSPETFLQNKTFIFAGKQNEILRNEFYPLAKRAQEKASILIFDEFCTYEFLYNLCFSCDVILMPYYVTDLSSGLLGYAAKFRKPVIGPINGLIGALIQKYNIGISVPIPIQSQSLKYTVLQNPLYEEYCSCNKSCSFIKNIML